MLEADQARVEDEGQDERDQQHGDVSPHPDDDRIGERGPEQLGLEQLDVIFQPPENDRSVTGPAGEAQVEREQDGEQTKDREQKVERRDKQVGYPVLTDFTPGESERGSLRSERGSSSHHYPPF